MKDMKRRAIRVVKRINIEGAGRPPAVVNSAKIKGDNKNTMVDEVGNWILERRENHRAETVFSNGKILSWKSASAGNLERGQFENG